MTDLILLRMPPWNEALIFPEIISILQNKQSSLNMLMKLSCGKNTLIDLKQPNETVVRFEKSFSFPGVSEHLGRFSCPHRSGTSVVPLVDRT